MRIELVELAIYLGYNIVEEPVGEFVLDLFLNPPVRGEVCRVRRSVTAQDPTLRKPDPQKVPMRGRFCGRGENDL